MKKYYKILKIRKKCDVEFYALFDGNAFNMSRCDRSAQNLAHFQSPIIHEKILQNSNKI